MSTLTKEAIIDKAAEVVLSSGFGHTRLEDIAKQIGVSRPNLYYYFRNKGELMISLLDKVEKEFNDQMLSGMRDDLEPDEKILYIVDFFITRLRERGYDGSCCIFGALTSKIVENSDPLKQRILSIIHSLVDRVQEIFEKGMRMGYFKAEFSSVKAAKMIIGGIEGSLVIANSERSLNYAQSFRSGVEEYLNILQRGSQV